MEKIIKKNQNFAFSIRGFNKIKKSSLKNFIFKRKNLSLFNENGEFTIKKNEINFINFLKKISKAKRKWKIYSFKKQYLKKFQYKKRKIRIKNYIQKNILSKNVINYYKIDNLINKSQQIVKNTKSYYVVDIFEILYIKIRLLKQYF